MIRKSFFVFAALAAASVNALACYTVFDRSNRVMYQGEDSPVDMSRPLHESLQERFPGGHMVFEQATRCEPVANAQMARPAPLTPVALSRVPDTSVMGAGPADGKVTRAPESLRERTMAGGSPLLTDRRTAVSMNLPYSVVSGNVVLVPAHAAARVDLPTFNVVPSQAASSGAVAAGTPGTVITELHDPPMTVVQRGQQVAVTRY